MRDIRAVIGEIKDKIPDSWANKGLFLNSLDGIIKRSVQVPPEKMEPVWIDLITKLIPIFQLPANNWSHSIVQVLCYSSPKDQEDGRIDWNTVKSYANLVKYLKNCPNCGSKHSLMVGSGLFIGRKNFFVSCFNCRKKTPELETVQDMITYWNADQKLA